MNINTNFNLKHFNTFGIDVNCFNFIEYSNNEEIIQFLKQNKDILKNNFLILGNGSNILFTKDFEGTIIHPTTNKITILSEKDENILLSAEAGLNFDEFIIWTLNNGIFGLENLSDIPGCVGASAVQNVGAYGVEAGDFIRSVTYLNLETFDIETIEKKNCNFSYRNSIFKNELKNKTLILSIIFELKKFFIPNLSYAEVKNKFTYLQENQEIQNAYNLRNLIMDIRSSKLPDYKKFGNAGSFFKNPIISKTKYNELKEYFPDVKYFDYDYENVKIAAGWLIDFCGFKGFCYKGAAVHDKQALIIINKNNSQPSDILEIAKIIQTKVFDTFGISLSPEVIFV